jgi:hypothetical protein
MKHSKLFLGISTGILAIVALTAARVTRFSMILNAYYRGANSTPCTRLASMQFFSIPATPVVQATAGPDGVPVHALLFTYNGGGSCARKLYRYGAAD